MLDQDSARATAKARAVFLEKFDGDPEPGDAPVEMIEIRYDEQENILSRATFTDPESIQECITRRVSAEKGVI